MTLCPISLFRQLHPLAEFSGKEVKTAAFIAEQLSALGIEYQAQVGGTGVVAYIRGEEPGPVVLFRADMDALPYSTDDGGVVAIHACGHDSHCAMLLAAVPKLREIVKRGTLKVVFQPGEENLTGALAMIEAGVGEDVDVAIAAHIRASQDLAPGKICAQINHVACTTHVVTIDGRPVHASRPHQGINPVDVAANMIIALNSMRLDPNESWSIKATRIQTEPGATNTLAAWARVMLDLRAQTNAGLREMVKKLETIAKHTAEAYDTTAKVELIEECPASEYDADLVALISETVVEELGAENLVASCGGGGEDFHFFKTKRPSTKTAYFGIGVGATPGLHDRNMSFDEKYLVNGPRMWVALAKKLLG